jgi:hypothetical protein
VQKAHKKLSRNSLLRPQDKKLSSANAIGVRDNRFVEIWPELSVQNIALAERKLSALDFAFSPATDSVEASALNVLQADIERVRVASGANLI